MGSLSRSRSRFIALTCSWLVSSTVAVLYSDAAQNLVRHVLLFADRLVRRRPSSRLSRPPQLLPAGGLFCASAGWASLVGGLGASTAPVLAQNLVFVPLLDAGLLPVPGGWVAGSIAGLLAVVFALGTPLLDRAVPRRHAGRASGRRSSRTSVWLVLESERFPPRRHRRAGGRRASASASRTKEPRPLYLIWRGRPCALARNEGWRNWRGLLAFAAAAFAVRLAVVSSAASKKWPDPRRRRPRATGSCARRPPLPFPLSLANGLTWYGWATLNSPLARAPLRCSRSIGVGHSLADLVRVVRALGSRR